MEGKHDDQNLFNKFSAQPTGHTRQHKGPIKCKRVTLLDECERVCVSLMDSSGANDGQNEASGEVIKYIHQNVGSIDQCCRRTRRPFTLDRLGHIPMDIVRMRAPPFCFFPHRSCAVTEWVSYYKMNRA